MRASLRHRGSICGWLAAVLVAQLLLSAAHACVSTVVPAVAVAHTHECDGEKSAPADGNPTPLCKVHCEAGQQSVKSSAGAVDVPQAPLAGAPLMRVLDIVAAEALAADMPAALAVGPPAGAPPLYLSLLVLRN
jgi:hypothetical protein